MIVPSPLPIVLSFRSFSYLVAGSIGSYLFFSAATQRESSLSPHIETHSINPIANRTLGFQHVFSIELPERTDRIRTLLDAANATDIEIIMRDGVRDSDVQGEKPPNLPDDIRTGDLACAVTHIRAWAMIVKERMHTTLITEGDVDWDPRLRDQLSAFATASASMTNFIPNSELSLSSSFSKTSPSSFSSTDSNTSPYGNDWDIIWFGSCGVSGEHHFPYADLTVAPKDKEHQLINFKFGHDAFPQSARQDNQRLVTNVRKGVCTQAYAISLRGAERMSEVANATDQMIDTYIGSKCGDGTLKCIAPWPQIFDDAKSTSSMNLPVGETVGEPKDAKGDSTLEYSIRVNADMIREGKGEEAWIRNWDRV